MCLLWRLCCKERSKHFGTKYTTFSWFPEQIKALHWPNPALNKGATIRKAKEQHWLQARILPCPDRWGQEEVTAYQSLAVTALASSPGPALVLQTVCRLNGTVWANMITLFWGRGRGRLDAGTGGVQSTIFVQYIAMTVQQGQYCTCLGWGGLAQRTASEWS